MPYKIVVINNKLWSGAKTIYLSHTNTFVNIYIGNGIKNRQTYYTPTLPLTVQSQFNEFQEIAIQNQENQQETIFFVQKEEVPPAPPKQDGNDENNQDENADKEAETE
eukprot:UN06751